MYVRMFYVSVRKYTLKKKAVNLHLVDYTQSTEHPSVETKSAVLTACFPPPFRGYQSFAATVQLRTQEASSQSTVDTNAWCFAAMTLETWKLNYLNSGNAGYTHRLTLQKI